MGFDYGGEYYGRIGEIGQSMGPFAKYLQDCGIVSQFTMPRTSKQNGVVKKWNHTLMDMVRSMMSRTNLPNFLWGKAINSAMYNMKQSAYQIST